MGNDSLIVFTPSGRRGRFAEGTPILTVARSLGVDIDSVCGGRGLCGRCQITLSVGDFAKHGISSREGHLSAVNDVETRYADKRGLKPGRRLSCQARLLGDLVIDVPPDSQVHKQVVRKRAEVRDIEIDPAWYTPPDVARELVTALPPTLQIPFKEMMDKQKES